MLIKRNKWNLLEDFFGSQNSNEILKTNIKEEENNYIFLIEVPGVSKDNVNIEVENGYLNISVTKNIENKEETEKYLCKEIHYGAFSRSFYIGDIEQKDVSAKCTNGILTITVPKVSESKNKQLVEIDWN